MNKKLKTTKTTTRTVGMAIIAIAMLTTVPMSHMVMAQEQQQGTDWSGICNQIQSILVGPCGQLVNTDGSFTTDGQRAHDCIQNGILL
jgi:type IV secretory pathway VirB2 component (pilin)